MTRQFHDTLVVIDALQHSNWDRELFQELRTGGVTAVHVTLAVWEDARATLSNIAKWLNWFDEHGDLVMPVRSVADIEMAQREEKTGIIFGFQNSSPLEDDVSMVSIFHELGVRIIQLTYNNQSLIGSSCYEKNDAGISRFGREVIQEMNRLGMLIDLSHCGDRTTLDAIEISQRPVAITHANLKSFHDGIRNKSDDVLKELARSGGMLGLSLYPLHLKGGAACTVADFCDAVKRAVDIMGIDQVGLGTDQSRKWTNDDLDWIRSGRWKKGVDFGEGSADNRGWPPWPQWFETPADFPNITAGLLENGFSQEEAAKIMGGNWMRFFANSFKAGEK